jgi:DNA adenine methylase
LAYYRPKVFVEPFAGGGSISLLAAAEGYAEKVVMVELDPEIAAVWHTVLSDDCQWLMKSIMNFDLTPENLYSELSVSPRSTKHRAFQTILRNRTAHGGIMAPGSGVIKNGEKGKGITSRWYPLTLSRRMEEIQCYRDKIEFIEGDGLQTLEEYDSAETCFFIDPPYTAGGKKAGRRLYSFSELDHDLLFELSSHTMGQTLLTYNDATELHDMADQHGFTWRRVAMQNTHLNKLTELLICRDFTWLEDQNLVASG